MRKRELLLAVVGCFMWLLGTQHAVAQMPPPTPLPTLTVTSPANNAVVPAGNVILKGTGSTPRTFVSGVLVTMGNPPLMTTLTSPRTAVDGKWQIDLGSLLPGMYTYTVMDQGNTGTVTGSFTVQ